NQDGTPGHQRPIRGDHEHVDRISSRTTMFIIATVAIIVYLIHWILLPFVVAGLLAYICSPVVDWLAARTRMPRALFACAAFAVLMIAASLMGWLGVPYLLQETTEVVGNFQGIIEGLAKGMIGGGSIDMFGQSMDAAQIAQTAAKGVRDWLLMSGRIAV